MALPRNSLTYCVSLIFFLLLFLFSECGLFFFKLQIYFSLQSSISLAGEGVMSKCVVATRKPPPPISYSSLLMSMHPFIVISHNNPQSLLSPHELIACFPHRYDRAYLQALINAEIKRMNIHASCFVCLFVFARSARKTFILG